MMNCQYWNCTFRIIRGELRNLQKHVSTSRLKLSVKQQTTRMASDWLQNFD